MQSTDKTVCVSVKDYYRYIYVMVSVEHVLYKPYTFIK